MSDYAQGGWAKLDCEAAKRLTSVLTTFQGKKFEEYSNMLLILYSSMNRDGSISIGYRTLAERAEVNEGQARYFIKKLEDSGILVNLGTVKNRNGGYTKRQFFWLSSQEKEGEQKNSLRGASKSHGKVAEGESKSSKKVAHIRYTEISDRDGGALDAAPPLRESNNNSVPNSEYTETDNLFPWTVPPPID